METILVIPKELESLEMFGQINHEKEKWKDEIYQHNQG
jgi:hypothetical protein